MPRRLLFAPLMLLVVLALPGVASAVVTSSTVTSPASPVTSLLNGNLPDADPSNRLVVAGTAAGLPGDEVDIRCAYRDPDGTVNTGRNFGDGLGVPIAGGAFSRDVLSLGQGACRIVATPTTLTPFDVTSFAGPDYFGSAHRAFSLGSGPYADLISNFYAGAGRPTLDVSFFSIGGGGAPAEMAPVDSSGDLPSYSQRLWGGNAALRPVSDLAGQTRSQLQVDGINAFTPDATAGLFAGGADAPGRLPITINSVTVDPGTGDLTHVSTEPFVTCPTAGGANVTAGTASLANCPEFVPSGVAVRRTVVVRAAARAGETQDRWVSTDGNTHRIDVV